ncbi:hypothetical protein JXM67_01305 [candidate division WOR-3 bacterium]|nr:hypothetical protein [candidate division WOR-3 bacterium]
MRKLILIGSVLILALSATQALAEDSYWSGTGDKVAWEESPGVIKYPWYAWSGTLLNGHFTGDWELPGDEDIEPVFRRFLGSITDYYAVIPGGHTYGHCEGIWYIEHKNTMRECGWFTMEFDFTDLKCHGAWGVEPGITLGHMWSYNYYGDD